MLQFYDRIVSKKGFVDLHIHTNDSYGDEMDKMELTPEELLESCLMYSINNNHAPVTFSITDHNSIDGVQKVDLLIKSDPEKYKNIHFITGCELTCSAGSFGTYLDENKHIKNIFQNFHMLAYNFNPFDENLHFLCKLHSTRKDNSVYYKTEKGKTIKISAGAYVLSIKNIMKDYGYVYPISEFKDVNLKTRNIDENTYVNYLMNYINKFNLPAEIKQDIKRQLLNRNMIHLGRLDCLEIMDIVEKAGGVCVLAHPKLLARSTHLKNSVETKKFFEDLLKSKNIEFHENEPFYSIVTKYFVHCLTVDAKNPITQEKLNGIVGMETFHTTGTDKSSILKNLIYIARNNNLYLTGGSDSHGSLLKDALLSDFLPSYIKEEKFKNNVVLTYNLFAEKILNGKIKTELKCYSKTDDQIKILKTTKSKEENTFEEKEITIKELESLIEGNKHKIEIKKHLSPEQKQKINNEQNKKATEQRKLLEKPIKESILILTKINKEIANFLANDDLNKLQISQFIKNQNFYKSNLKLKLNLVAKNLENVNKLGSYIYLNSLIESHNLLINKVNINHNLKLSYLKIERKYTKTELKNKKISDKLNYNKQQFNALEVKANDVIKLFEILNNHLTYLICQNYSLNKTKEEFHKSIEIRQTILKQMKEFTKFKLKDLDKSLIVSKLIKCEEQFNKLTENLNNKFNSFDFNLLTNINPFTYNEEKDVTK